MRAEGTNYYVQLGILHYDICFFCLIFPSHVFILQGKSTLISRKTERWKARGLFSSLFGLKAKHSGVRCCQKYIWICMQMNPDHLRLSARIYRAAKPFFFPTLLFLLCTGKESDTCSKLSWVHTRGQWGTFFGGKLKHKRISPSWLIISICLWPQSSSRLIIGYYYHLKRW